MTMNPKRVFFIILALGFSSSGLAIASQSGCVKWVYDSPTPLRTSLTYGRLGNAGVQAVVFGDARGFVYTLGGNHWGICLQTLGSGFATALIQVKLRNLQLTTIVAKSMHAVGNSTVELLL